MSLDIVYFENFHPTIRGHEYLDLEGTVPVSVIAKEDEDDEDEWAVAFKFLQRMNSALLVSNKNSKDHMKALSNLSFMDLEITSTITPDNSFASPKDDEQGNRRNSFVACVAPRRAQLVFSENDDDSLTYKTMAPNG